METNWGPEDESVINSAPSDSDTSFIVGGK